MKVSGTPVQPMSQQIIAIPGLDQSICATKRPDCLHNLLARLDYVIGGTPPHRATGIGEGKPALNHPPAYCDVH